MVLILLRKTKPLEEVVFTNKTQRCQHVTALLIPPCSPAESSGNTYKSRRKKTQEKQNNAERLTADYMHANIFSN